VKPQGSDLRLTVLPRQQIDLLAEPGAAARLALIKVLCTLLVGRRAIIAEHELVPSCSFRWVSMVLWRCTQFS
jgi:hypothetical protein